MTTIRECTRWRAVVVLVVLGVLLSGPAAGAAPVTDLSTLPTELQKYVPGTPAWAASAWMTAPGCADRGGDFSVWAASVLADTPLLLEVFHASTFGRDAPPEGRPRAQAILDGYRAIAADLGGAVPAGFCVDDLRGWAPDASMVPFGFAWGVTEGSDHQTSVYCTDRAAGSSRAAEANRYVGAERAPCDGFYVACTEVQGEDQQRCAAWNEFSDRYVLRVQRMRNQAIADHPATGQADTDTDLAGPRDLAEDAAMGWFETITLALATAAATVMAEAMTWWTRTERTEMLSSPVIGEIQDTLSFIGYALLAGGVMWQGMLLMLRRKADPLVTTATGLLSFVAWSTLGATVAVLLNEAGAALSEQVLDGSIDGFAQRMGIAMQANIVGNVALVFLLSIILFVLACVQWLLGFFRTGAVVILLALIPTAAAGQLTERTKPWLPKVVGWCLALLLYQPIASIIYAIGFRLMGQGQDVATVLVGMAVLTMAVVAMPALLRFFDWGGQRLVAGGGGGAAMAVGAAASVLGGSGGFGRFMDSNGPASRGQNGGNGSGAVSVTPAHRGDGSTSAPGGQLTGSATGGGSSSAAGGSVGAGTGAIGGAGAAQGTATGAGAASGAGAGAASAGAGAGAGAGAAAGGPVGAVVAVGAQVVKGASEQAAGAMTEGVGD